VRLPARLLYHQSRTVRRRHDIGPRAGDGWATPPMPGRGADQFEPIEEVRSATGICAGRSIQPAGRRKLKSPTGKNVGERGQAGY